MEILFLLLVEKEERKLPVDLALRKERNALSQDLIGQLHLQWDFNAGFALDDA